VIIRRPSTILSNLSFSSSATRSHIFVVDSSAHIRQSPPIVAVRRRSFFFIAFSPTFLADRHSLPIYKSLFKDCSLRELSRIVAVRRRFVLAYSPFIRELRDPSRLQIFVVDYLSSSPTDHRRSSLFIAFHCRSFFLIARSLTFIANRHRSSPFACCNTLRRHHHALVLIPVAHFPRRVLTSFASRRSSPSFFFVARSPTFILDSHK
jgi:hypothetical protein